MRVTCKLVTQSPFAKRHSLVVDWSRETSPSAFLPSEFLSCETDARSFKVEMKSIACPDVTQSEAYISTIALFSIFASTSEQKVYMRLPSVWRELWEELSRLSKEHEDQEERHVLRGLRGMVEGVGRRDDGLPSNVTLVNSGDVSLDRKIESLSKFSSQQPTPSPEDLRATWGAKQRTPNYKRMFLGRENLPIYGFKDDLLLAIAEHQVVIVCGETGCGKSTQGQSCMFEQRVSAIDFL